MQHDLTLTGPGVRLVPLGAEHAAALAAFVDERVWRGMSTPTPRGEAGMLVEVEQALATPGRYAFAVLDSASGEVLGSTSYYDVDRRTGRLEVGYTFYAPAVWGTHVNPACKLALLTHAFEVWGVHRVALRVDARNARSLAAVARLGAVEEGRLRSHRLAPDGSRGDSVYFSVLPDEWPQVRTNLLTRLSPPPPTSPPPPADAPTPAFVPAPGEPLVAPSALPAHDAAIGGAAIGGAAIGDAARGDAATGDAARGDAAIGDPVVVRHAEGDAARRATTGSLNVAANVAANAAAGGAAGVDEQGGGRGDGRSHLVLVGGRSGVGKTSVAHALHALLVEADVRHALIEGDYLDLAHPAPHAHRLTERNLRAVWSAYRELGYRRLVYTNTVSPQYADDLAAAMGDGPRVTAVLLTADDETARARLAQRETGDELRRHVERSDAAARALERGCPPSVHRLDASAATPESLAHQIATLAGWLPPAG